VTASISDLAMLGDCRSAAMVDRSGEVVWWCPERFDGDAWFASLLGDAGGSWSLRPVDAVSATRGYVGESLVLSTRFETETGVVELTEGLLFAGGARGHEIGLGSPRVLARTLTCLAGEVAVEHRFDPRPDYGLTLPALRREGSAVHAISGFRGLSLDAGGNRLEPAAHGLYERIGLRVGERRGFVCGFRRSGEPRLVLDPFASLEDTVRGWHSWAELHSAPDGLAAERVRFAGRVIQGLTYQETGAIVASPTTSLPEIPGGEANWDYRYAWLRDSSVVVDALQSALCADEARRYFNWLARAALDGDQDGDTQVVYGPGGERLLPELELDHLEGFRGSRPVRVGNLAYAQRQLDVHGHVLDAAATFRELRHSDTRLQEFLRQEAHRAEQRWELPDAGIWERREQQQHTSSKLMCWLALERACTFARYLGAGGNAVRWRRAQDEISRRLWAEAWDDERGVFVSTLGGRDLDASALLFVTKGFLLPHDDRARRLVDGIEADLADDGLVRRWSGCGDGAFLLCSFWLAEALAITGRDERALEVFERAAGAANDLGLLPEEVDPATGEALGNTPLGLSHAGLVCAAGVLADSEGRKRRLEGAAA
jgi:GH15 family glucan-1,4-alpha-glucosidase